MPINIEEIRQDVAYSIEKLVDEIKRLRDENATLKDDNQYLEMKIKVLVNK